MRLYPNVKTFIALLVGFSLPVNAATITPSVAVIVRLDNPIENLSKDALRELLVGLTVQWPNRRNVIIVEREPGSAILDTLLRKCLNTNLRDYNRQLLDLEFRGKNPAVIKILKSDDGTCAFVFNVPGAIGFVSDSALSLPSCHEQVKVLQISKKKLGEAGYPLTLESR